MLLTPEPGVVDLYGSFVAAAMATVRGANSQPISTLVPAARSVAAEDVAGQTKFNTPSSEDHIQHAQDEARLLAAAAVDHLAQYIRVVFTEPPAVYAHFGIARDGIAAAGTGLWLLDRSVDLPVRIQRMQALRLKNASEMKRVKRGDTAATALRIEAEVTGLASHHSWILKGGVSVAGQAAPSLLDLFERALALSVQSGS